MTGMSKDKLVFDTSVGLDENDNIGSFIRAADGSLITKTTVSGKDGLDVNLINASIAVTATNLDVRDLAFATDKVDTSGSTIELGATTLAALENITVDGTVELGATTLAALENITVSATNLDIRDLAFATDKVDVSGSTVKLQDGSGNAITSTTGSLNVAVTSGTISATLTPNYAFTEGSAFTTAVDEGAFILAIDPSGNYRGLNIDGSGNLKVAGSMTVTNAAPTVSATQAIVVGTTAIKLPTSALANRKKILLKNNSSKVMYFGETGVTSATGMPLAAGANVELDAAAALDVFIIGSAASLDLRIREIN